MTASDPFAELVARLDPGMVVVTVAAGTERDGCLVGFHSQASIEPPRFVVWLSVANRTYRLAADPGATHLGVHVLAADDVELAERFGGSTEDDPDVDKLAGLRSSVGPGGVPVLDDVAARFVGRILSREPIAGADHVPFLLEPVEVWTAPDAARPPLRLHQTHHIEPGHPA